VISQNKDVTLSPRFYSNKNLLLQTEYRQKNKKSNHIIDSSYFAEKDKINESHFFYNYFKELNNKNFERELNLKIEQTSNDTYLKLNKLNSEIINDENILENSIDFNLFSDDLSLNLNASIYENLNRVKSDRYEYTFPSLQFVKQINNKTNFNGNFILKSQASINNYNTNVLEKKNINDLLFDSFPTITKGGFYNEYSFLIKNYNSDNKNSDYKNKQNFYLSSIFQYDVSLPLIKENSINRNILKPKISLKLSPSHTKNNINEDTKLDINNIYALDRLSDKTLEGGISMTYGADYSIFNKNKSIENLKFKVANNLRVRDNEDLPKINQMGEQISNIFSEAIYKPNDNIVISYSNALKNNLKNITYENFKTELKVDKFLTTFDYLNENYVGSNNSYLSSKTSYLLDSNNSISYSTRENKTKDLTEYYKFMYQYKNDCLSASIEFNKDYYSDRNLKPNKSLLLKINIIPFGEASSLNLLENEK
jgi:LPS-assembly protein